MRVISVRIPEYQYHLLEAIRSQAERETVSEVVRELVAERTDPVRPSPPPARTAAAS